MVKAIKYVTDSNWNDAQIIYINNARYKNLNDL